MNYLSSAILLVVILFVIITYVLAETKIGSNERRATQVAPSAPERSYADRADSATAFDPEAEFDRDIDRSQSTRGRN